MGNKLYQIYQIALSPPTIGAIIKFSEQCFVWSKYKQISFQWITN